MGRPDRFVGLHFFYHPAKNRLVEIIPAETTTAATLAADEQYCKTMGKVGIVCKDRPGFVVNRFFVPWLNEACKLLEEGVATGTSSLKDFVNYKTSSNKLHQLVMKELNEKHKKIYHMLYIENIDENDVAKKFGFKADASKRKKPRYKQMANLKKKFYTIAVKIMKDHDIL